MSDYHGPTYQVAGASDRVERVEIERLQEDNERLRSMVIKQANTIRELRAGR